MSPSACPLQAELPLAVKQLGDEEYLIWISAVHIPKEEMHVIDWVEAQQEDPVICKMIEWMKSDKKQSLNFDLGDDNSTSEGLGLISWHRSLVLVNGKLYLNCKLKGKAEMTTVFIVPKAHRQKATDGCHQDMGHQGQNRTVSVLLEWFWWSGMTMEVKREVKQGIQCIKHEGKSRWDPLVPIIASGPMSLMHLNFTKIEMSGDSERDLKKRPVIVNWLVITDNLTHHTMAFVTEDQMAKTVA